MALPYYGTFELFWRGIDLTEKSGFQKTRPYPIGIFSYFFKFYKTQKYAHALLRESYTILISLSRNQLLYI
jgi:hypothetical protein